MSTVRALLPWLLLLLAASAPYLNALDADFVYDDEGLILKNPAVQPERPWWVSLTAPFWPNQDAAGLYRPATSLSYRLQLAWHGPDPGPFHGANVALHALVTLTAAWVLLRLFPRHRRWAWAVALLFAVHPVHTEAVTGVFGRGELLAALFGLLGYGLWLRAGTIHRPIGASAAGLGAVALSFALAMGSKESAIGWLLVAGAHRAGLLGDERSYARLRIRNRGALRQAVLADGALAVGVAGYLIARRAVLGSLLGLGEVTPIDNPVFAAPLDVRVLTAGKVLGRYLELLVWPHRLSVDYSYDTIAPVTSWASGAGLMLLAALLAVVLLIRLARQAPRLAWGGAVWAVLLLPVSNLLFPIGTIMAERLLYLPSLGFLALVAAAADRAAGVVDARRRWTRPALVGLLVLLLTAGAARTWDRNRDWRTNLDLFLAAERVAPRSVRVHCNLGASLLREDRVQQAEEHYRRAHRIAPDYHTALKGLGHALILQRRYAEAETLLRRAVAVRPRDAEARYRLGNLLLEVGRGQEALETFERLLALHPQSREGLIGRASALFLLERFEEAADAWERAYRAHGRSPELGRHVAVAQIRAGRPGDAITTLREVLTRTPGEADLQHEFARLLLEAEDAGDEGLRAARAAVAIDPRPSYVRTLISYLAATGRCGEIARLLESTTVAHLSEAQSDSLRAYAADLCPASP